MNSGHFLRALGINPADKLGIQELSRRTGVSVESLLYYDATDTFPSGNDLTNICKLSKLTPVELMLRMGRLDRPLISLIQHNADEIAKILNKSDVQTIDKLPELPSLVYETENGQLHQGDCLALMRNLASDSIDVIFADPPFNLNKLYPSGIDDDLKETHYLEWCETWLNQCVRLLKPGGSLFVWNIPKWNTHFTQYLNSRLTFRNWIAVDIKYALPISGRLYPSHYSLLYYCKGPKPKVFHPDRLPMEVCPHCKDDLRDYGGYKDRMNPMGVNLTDVWFDISPVRHAKYKRRKDANELPIKLLDRIIEMSSNEQDIVFDPFGGSGTTYITAEIKNRRWIGIEIGPVDDIINRFTNIDEDRKYLKNIRQNYNQLFTAETLKVRQKKGFWTAESVRKNDSEELDTSTKQHYLKLES